jgi:hypothetical protein
MRPTAHNHTHDHQGDGTVINAILGRASFFGRGRTQLAPRRTCALVVPVFEGSDPYDLRFTDIKRETLPTSGQDARCQPSLGRPSGRGQAAFFQRSTLVLPDLEEEMIGAKQRLDLGDWIWWI